MSDTVAKYVAFLSQVQFTECFLHRCVVGFLICFGVKAVHNILRASELLLESSFMII